MIALDSEWAAGNPLPLPAGETDKNQRGRLLVAGGSDAVPGAALLTGEAGYRAGAGKVQLAVPESAAIPLGVRMPEAAVYGLPTNGDGELGPEPARLVELIARCDALVFGPGMGEAADAVPMLRAILATQARDVALLLDAGALFAARQCEAALREWPGPLVLTPHPGEMAALIGCDTDAVHPDMALEASRHFGATVVLKRAESWVVGVDGAQLHYSGGGPGLATGGSGDVLAGLIGGLLARGLDPLLAAAWGVYAHGEAGKLLARQMGALGFLARELLQLMPALFYGRQEHDTSR